MQPMTARENRDPSSLEAVVADTARKPGNPQMPMGLNRQLGPNQTSALGGAQQSGPMLGPPHRERYYATRLRQLARLDLEESQAEELWRGAARHRQELLRKLGRDVGQRVALLDFVLNVRPQLVEPQIIEKAT